MDAGTKIESYMDRLDVVGNKITVEEMYIECQRFRLQHPAKSCWGCWIIPKSWS
jgi:hypothetical protein